MDVVLGPHISPFESVEPLEVFVASKDPEGDACFSVQGRDIMDIMAGMAHEGVRDIELHLEGRQGLLSLQYKNWTDFQDDTETHEEIRDVLQDPYQNVDVGCQVNQLVPLFRAWQKRVKP